LTASQFSKNWIYLVGYGSIGIGSYYSSYSGTASLGDIRGSVFTGNMVTVTGSGHLWSG
jgi:hypothetical protein